MQTVVIVYSGDVQPINFPSTSSNQVLNRHLSWNENAGCVPILLTTGCQLSESGHQFSI